MARTARKPQLVTRTREAILDAATAVFAQQGYHAVTMKDIASAAGYTAPSLYNYFGSKEEIFGALLERIHLANLATFDEPVPRGLTFAQRLELLVRRQLDVRTRHADAFALFMRLQSGGMPSEELARWTQQAFTDFLDRLTQWVTESAGEAELGRHDAETLAFHLWGTMAADHARALLGRDAEANVQAHTQRIVALFLHGARGGE
jgi:TetR/AcrR family fatty acid metabolism transcriptional regulator